MGAPGEWSKEGVHWHAHAEFADSTDPVRSTSRPARRGRCPDIVLRTPDEVAEWIAAMTREHVHPREVRLIGAGGGFGVVGDEDQIEADRQRNAEIVGRGDSLYYSFGGTTGRVHLWVEAVTADECSGDHDTARAR